MSQYVTENRRYSKDGTWETRTIKYFKVSANSISIHGSKVAGMTSSSLKGKSIHGVNGTFYHTTPLKVYGVAINNGVIANVNLSDQDGGILVKKITLP